jgi:hypothetical protein
MGDLIDRINTAERMVNWYRQGTLAFVVVRDRLIEEGWYGVTQRGDRICAYLNGVRWEL